MRRTTHRLLGALRWRAGPLLAVGLVLGSGARAATSAEPPEPPTLSDIKPVDPLGLNFTWSTSGQQTIDGIRLNFYQNDSFAFHFNHSTGGKKSGILTIDFPRDLKPNTRYCLGLKAYVGTGANGASRSRKRASGVASPPWRAAPQTVRRAGPLQPTPRPSQSPRPSRT